ncbi:major facilitator superfamily domain-containing protein [Dichotomopilus funicola]|uniref:Major facilitator superfamily domain-containing protein n=1 Tax=Dichotomopilus funicola TaxID=1934379 RepID=A0AAN6ZPF5_9PEZI|nr:major facilitator superfamily domain-containing protein [Dichotomopilus funicola]
MTQDAPSPPPGRTWGSLFTRKAAGEKASRQKSGPSRWSMGIMEDSETIEVPGSVLLLAADHNEPLGLRNAPARTSHSSIPTGIIHQAPEEPPEQQGPKKTPDGKFILDPQPEDSANDPLNWPAWRRDIALLSLGLFCMVGGGTTPLLAAGFTDVANEYDVDVHSVSLTTGLYMLGMGLGSIIFSPTAILYGKRPVYLFGAVLYIATSVWCAASPNFTSLILARIFQGIAVSPVECLPSATIAEIFFLHERAFRIGIYTLLLLGGKNLVPLVSAAIIQSMGWRWVFWVVAIVVTVCGLLLFFFVPETFWDRAPVPRKLKKSKSRPSIFRRLSSRQDVLRATPIPTARPSMDIHHHHHAADHPIQPLTPGARSKGQHVAFAPPGGVKFADASSEESTNRGSGENNPTTTEKEAEAAATASDGGSAGENDSYFPPQPTTTTTTFLRPPSPAAAAAAARLTVPGTPHTPRTPETPAVHSHFHHHDHGASDHHYETDTESQSVRSGSFRSTAAAPGTGMPLAYTAALRDQPALSFVQALKPFHGRLNKDKWHKVAIRPLILFTYPAVLWSAVVYACSVGWLIVISESVAVIYREGIYEFNALQTGLVYISPFVGGILGSAVAGRVSDVIAKAMARRNGGLYEPEFRLVMAIPIAVTTVIGLMGFGWSAQIHDHWMVPTAFFGIISFGCTMGSTTSITFCVDSYRQYAGEALVTLNFSKNVLHGLVFSLFVTGWISSDGPKSVYIWIGVIQLILLLFTIPMYIFGKRLRMWTVRRNFMERF